MTIKDTDLNPFSLASGALALARDQDQEGIYGKWRAVLKKFDRLRGSIDPIADQNANLDILLRSFEGELASRHRSGRGHSGDTAGLQLHIHLSRLWVFGAYEFLRTLHEVLKKSSEESYCLTGANQKGCGEMHCILCSIGHLKNEMAVVRIPMAKSQVARDVLNPPLPERMKENLRIEPVAKKPPFSKFLLPEEGMRDGEIYWVKFDKRVERNREISRRDLSDKILSWEALGACVSWAP